MMPKKHVKHKMFLMFFNLEHENFSLLSINNNMAYQARQRLLIMFETQHHVASGSPNLRLSVKRQELCQLRYCSQTHAVFHCLEASDRAVAH
jgi:hypothetical protein